MNGPFQVAQANIATQTSGKPPARIVKVTKPFGEQSVVVPLSYDGSVKADLSSIAGENITLVHIGEKLIILFDNKSTVTLEPFFDSNGAPLNGITVEVSPGRDLTGTEFAALFPVTEDRSILPAAGDGNGPGAQASGANFTSVNVDPLAAPNPIDLLGQEDLPTFAINTILRQNDFINGIPSAGLTGVIALDEDELPGVFGNPNGPGDIDAPHTFSGTLTHDFGLDLAGDITFAAMNGVQQVINGITVTFTWNDATHTLTANDGSGDVFEVVITNPATGAYTVTLLGPLHHHADGLADNAETSDIFNLTYTVTDSNGTTANGTLALEINDDTPVAHDSAPTDTTVVIGEGEGQEGGNGEVVTHYATIDDEAQSGNTGDDTNGDDAGESSSVSGKLDIAPGADGLKAVAFTGLDGQPHVTVTADDGSHPTLQVIFVDPQTGIGTPENVTLVWQADGNGGGTLIGVSDHFSANNPAFTLTVDSQGNYTFDVHAPFAQPLTTDGSEGSSQIGWEDNIHVQFTYTATDGDGDKSSATLTFDIDDDTPTVVVTTDERGEGQEGKSLLVSLDESIGGDRGSLQSPTDGASDDTGNTQPDPTGTNPIGRMETAAGEGENAGGLQSLFNVIKSPGADGEKSTTYSYTFSLTGTGNGGEGEGQNTGVETSLKATGYENGTIYLFQEDATHIVGRVGGENGDIAIRITLTDANDLSGGQLVVEQYLAIDHGEDGNDFDTTKLLELVGEGASLGVTLTTTVTDGDGDQATASATYTLADGQSSTIGFQDDGPAPLAISAANGAANGLFFEGFAPNNDQWGAGSGINTSGTAGAWHIAASSHDGASNVQLERVGDGYRGADSPTDGVMVDMEATPGNLKLTQDIGGLTEGSVYHLTFEIGAANDAAAGSAKLAVFWNGVQVGEYTPNSGVMQTISIDVTAGNGNNQLTFEEIGTSGDNTGTFLANVKLADAIIIDETSGNDPGSNDTDSAAVAALFASVADTGIDPNMDHPQYAQGQHPVIVLGTPDYGTDGPAATNPIQVGLAVSSAGVDSGLTTTEGQHIYLFVENGLIVGRFDADGDANHTPETAAFALSIDQSGNLSIAQYVSLHQPDTGSHDEGVYLNPGTVLATVTLTDGDGDHTTSSADISSAIRFEDDGPSIDAAQNSSLRDWTLDEDVLPTGNDAFDNPADTNDYTAINGKPLGVNWGADGAKALTFAATDDQHPTIVVTDKNGAPVTDGLSSGGVALTYEITTNPDGGQTLTAYKGGDHSKVIFTLTLDPDAGSSGTFSFELKGPLDHPTGDGENTLNLNFGFTATDGDNDTASSSVTIRITDDVPVVASNGTNYITNGDFQAGNWSAPAWWGSAATNVPGWSISGDPSLPPQNGIQFERPLDGYLGLHSSTHDGMIDMGGSPGNYDLTQQIGANGTPHLVNGQQYVLELEVGAPFPSTAKMEVWWNNTLIGVIDTNVSSGQMEKFAFIVTGSGNPATDQLTFKEVGEGTAPINGTVNGQPLQGESYHGTYIANVKMFALNGVVDEDALNNAHAHGIGDSQPGDGPDGNAVAGNVTIGGTLGVKWGSDETDVDDVNGIQDGAGSTLTGRSLTFTDANVTVFGVNTLTSNGDAVSFARIGNNTKLVGFVDNDHNGTYSNGDRLVFDVTLSDDGSGSFKFTLHDNLDHAPGASENDIALQFNFTATDSDGDSAKGTFAVGVDDDLPVLVNGGEVSVSVNENDILTPWSVGTSPNIFDGSTELFTGAAKVTGTLAAAVKFGADGAGHGGFAFADKATVIAYMESLHLFSKETALPENGKELTYDLVGNVLIATEPGPDGNIVFTLTLNSNGSFEFRLFDELVHVAGDGTNTDLRSGDSSSISGIEFGHIIVATDGDGDSVTLGDNFEIKIVDDVPQVSISRTLLGAVQHDETPGVDLVFDSDTNSAAVKALFTGVVNPGDDLNVDGSGAIGYAHSSLPLVNVGVNYGADTPALSQTLSLQLIDGNTGKPAAEGFQRDSGLFTTEHQKIILSKEGDLIVGRVDADGNGHVDQNDVAAFAIHIGQDGDVSIVQYLSLQHPNTSSSDENVDLNGLIAAQVSVTDSDGDTATDFVNIGDKIRFGDDGPQAVNDSQKTVTEGASAIGGNVMTNDDASADGATVTMVRVDGHNYSVPQDGSATTVTTSLGVYTFDNHGNWTFTPNGNLNNANGVDASFTYTLTDGDGDADTAKQTIKVNDGANPTVSSNITITLDEEALGNANATGTNPSSTAEQDSSHTLTFTSGSDNIKSIAFAAGTNGITVNVDGINGADIVWTRVDGTHLIGKIGGVDAISVELTLPGLPILAGGHTGDVTVTATLLDNFPHPKGGGENTITLSGIKVVATDTDNDTVTGNVNVTINDDVPAATAEASQNVVEGGLAQGQLDFVGGADGATVTHIGNVKLIFGNDGFSQSVDIGAGTIKVKSDGSYVFTADASVNNTNGDVPVHTTFTVTDRDGDTSTANIDFAVTDTGIASVSASNAAADEDDIPVIGNNNDPAAGDDVTSASGHISYTLGADAVKSVELSANTTGLIKLDGTPIHTAWDQQTHTLIGYGTDINDIVFKIVVTDVNNTGANYEVTLVQPILHPDYTDPSNPASTSYEDNKGFTVTVTVTDADDSQNTATFTVSIDDDSPVILSPEDGSTSEVNIAAATAVAHGSLGIHFGADGPAAPAAPSSGGTPRTINFDDAHNGTLPGNQYTHDGFTFHTNQGIANATGTAGQMYGTVITVADNGGQPFTITQMDLGLYGTSTGAPADNVRLTGVDANTGETIVVIFNVGTTISLGGAGTTFHAAGTDFEGVSLSSLTIEPVLGWQGNYIFNGSVVVDNVVFSSGSAPLTHGAVSFADLTTAINNVTIVDSDHHAVAPASLTSHGETIHYALLDSMTLVGYTGDTAPTAIDGTNVVFSVVLSQDANHPNGAYDFTLRQPLDDLPSGVSDLNFTFDFTAKDGDGDAVNGHFSIDVKDDVPTIVHDAVVGGAVDEDALTVASIGNADDQRSGETAGIGSASATVSGEANSLNALVHFGADGPGVIQLASQADAKSWIVGLDLWSQGHKIDNVMISGHTLTALADDGRSVFSLLINDDGSWKFTLIDQIDHPVTNDPETPLEEKAFEDTISLDLSGLLVATDGDGDPTPLAGANFEITVRDDIPYFDAVAPVTVTDVGELVTGTSGFHVGADEPGQLSVTAPEIDGVSVTSSTDDDGVITVTGTFSDSGKVYYVLSVNPDGTYQFEIENLPSVEKPVAEVDLSAGFGPIPSKDFGAFTISANNGHNINGSGGGVGVDNANSDGSEGLTIKFDHQMTVADLGLKFMGNEDITLQWKAYSSTDPSHFETGTKTFHAHADGSLTVDIVDHDGGTTNIPNFDTLEITGVTGKVKISSVGGTEIVEDQHPTSFDFGLTGTDKDGDAASGAIHINYQPDLLPSVTAPPISVDEKGLPPHGAGLPAGSGEMANGNANDNSDQSERHSGTITIEPGDGPSVVTINGVTVLAAGQDISGTYGTLHIDSVTPTSISYTYTLTKNGSGDAAHDDFAIKVTDSDGDPATTTLSISIVDDVPAATAEGLQTVAEGASIQGKLDFVAGADGATVTHINGVELHFGQGNGYSQSVDIGAGTIKVKADGSYIFTAGASVDNTHGDVPVHATFTVTDGDDDTSTADVDFAVTDANVPEGGTSKATVDDDGLTGGNGESTVGDASDSNADGDNNEATFAGTLAGATGADVPGTFDFASLDGAQGTVGQESVKYSWAGNTLTAMVSGGDRNGTPLFSVEVDPTTGAYQVTLLHNILHSAGDNAEAGDITVSLPYTITDSDGSHTTGTLQITFDDDAPTAHAGNAVSIDETAGVMIGDNLLSGDSNGVGKDALGADGATVTHVKLPGSSQFEEISTWASDGHGGHTKDVAGVGVYTFNADGSWTFDPHSNASNANIDGSFSYRITDGDGDTSEATQTVTVVNTNSLPTAGEATASIDDDGLQHGNPGDADNGDVALPSPENVANGTLPHDYQADGKASSDPIGFAPMDGQHGTVGTESVTYHWDATSNTLTATSDAGRGDIFKIVVDDTTNDGIDNGTDSGNGNYQLTLLQPVMHDDGDGENNATVELTYQVKDSSDDTAEGKLTVTFNDDTPVAHDQTASVTEGSTPTLNAILVIDLSASMNDSSGVQGLTRLELMQQAVANYLNSSGVHFNEIVIYTFNDGAHYEGTFTNVQDAINKVNSYDSNDLVAATEYDSTAEDVREHFEDNVHLTEADQTHLLFLSDGDPTGGSALNTQTEQNNWRDFLNDAGVDKVFAVGFGGIDDTSFLNPMAPRPGDEAIAVENPDQLAATLEGSLPSSISGNVLFGQDGVAGGGDDVSFGADGGHIHSIKVGDVTYTYHPETGDITASDGHNPVQNTPELTVTTALGGALEFNFQTGAWEYSAPPNGVSQTTNENFDYVIVDGDGDTADATLTVTVVDVPNQPPVLHLNEPGESGNVSDNFSSSGYGGGSGWSGSWVESSDGGGSNGGASSGDIRLSGSGSNGRLRFGDDNDNNDGSAGGATITRDVDLTNAVSAKLTFSVVQDDANTGEDLIIEAWNGTTWQEIGRVLGSASNGTTNFDIDLTAAQMGPDSSIRFRMETGLEEDEFYYIDNVNVAYTTVTPSVDHVASFTENGDAISIAPAGPTITDTDDTVMESAKIVLTNAKAGDVLAVGGLPAGIGYTIDTSVAGQITVNLSGNASLASYQAAIKAVTYQNTSDNPGSDDRVIHVTVTDDHGNASNVATTTVHVTPINDAPTTNDVSVSANEGVSSIAISLTGGDVDGTVSSFKITGLPSGGTLYSDAALTQVIANGDTVSASGNSATVYFKPASDDANGTMTFKYAAVDNDGTADGSPATATINITPVNDAPEGADKTFALSIGGSKTFTASDFGFSDTHDSPANAPKSVIITTLPGEGRLTLNGIAVTAGQEITADKIGGLKFTAIGSEVGENYASFTFQVRDNGGTANGGVDTDQTPNTITFDIPTPPVIWAPSDFNFAPASTNNSDMFTKLNLLKFSDAGSTGPVTVKLETDDGAARFLATSSSDVTVSGNNTTSMTLTGTLAAINAFIADNHLTYDLNNSSGDEITVTITDSRGATDTATIDINDNYIGGGNGQNLPSADTFNIHQALIDLGGGSDSITTGWNHLATDPTTYRGGESGGNDTIRVVFTGDQLNEILNNVTQRDDLRDFLSNPDAHDLDLSSSSWHAKVEQFEVANLGLATPHPTGSQDNYLDLATWKALPAAVGSGTSGADLMVGTAAGQTLDGLDGNDVLAAYHGGANTLNGGGGKDLLLGGDGDDVLNGGQGNDTLSGGKGADMFRIDAVGTSHQDTIVDYDFTQGDKLDLSALLDSAFDPGDNINSFVKVQVSGDDLLVRVNASGNGNFTDAQNAFLLVGAHTSGGGDPIKLYFDGHDHVVTG
ncbi:T1SS-143 domain-containing protein [Nitrobacteraceae bacterium AZCC 1564]